MSTSFNQVQMPPDFSADPEALVWRERVVETLTRRSWPQSEWIRPSAFNIFVKKRGLNADISLLEKWDKMGVFHPLIRYRYPVTTHRKLPNSRRDYDPEPFEGEITEENRSEFTGIIHNGWSPEDVHRPEFAERASEFLQFATVENFVPWNDYRVANDPYRSSLGGVSYHPSQIFRLQQALDTARVTCTFTDLEVIDRAQKHFQQDINRGRKSLITNEVWHLKTLYLLALIEDRYLPHWRGPRHQLQVKLRISYYDKEEDIDNWHQFASRFDAAAVLASCELSLDEVQEIRKDLAWRGGCLDPNSSFYLLFRHFAHEERQQFKGNALLAWDYYGAAEMIGWFLRDATGEKQAQTDDLNTSNGWWKKERYGVEADDINFNSGNILRPLLHSYALDPFYKLLLVIEGESEAEFIRTWCEAAEWDLDLMGIRLLTLDGIPGINSKTAQQYIEQAKTDGASVILVVDDEVASIEKVDKWVENKLLARRFGIEELNSPNSPIGGLVWSPCFEEVNFSLEQLLQAWFDCLEEWLSKRGKEGIGDRKQEIKRIVESIRDNPPPTKKCDSWIDAMGLASQRCRVRLNKPELARKLALLFGQEDIPLVRLLYHCRHIAEMATTYGPPRTNGGFGFHDEDEEASLETT